MNDTFLRACLGKEVDYTPVWFMRQAGRYMKEYQRIRKGMDFLTLCKTPELAAEVTLQPVEILGVDAAILFSDILIPVEAMGMELKFYEKRGPVFRNPIRDEKGVKGMRIIEPERDVPFVIKTIELLRKRLDVPLIGFSGAPFTLATYMIEGGTSKNFLLTKRMMFQGSELYASLMDKITETITKYLIAQIRAGAQAVQIFDTWAGVLSPQDYRRYALPYVKRVISEIRSAIKGIPIIYFVGQCAGLLEEIKKCKADVIGIDWRLNIDDAIKRLGNGVSVQGNLDPCALFLPKDKIRPIIKDILKRASIARGHIFNLGHGVLPETPVENVKAVVEMVHEMSIRS
ncbi:MAG: uroporphyrinogen decarboxylase [Thermodesulfovibrionia bacterium]